MCPGAMLYEKKKYTLVSISQGRRAILGSKDSSSEAIFSVEDLEGKINGINTSFSEHTLYFSFFSARYKDAIRDSSQHKYIILIYLLHLTLAPGH